jgi:hypothetical protein
MKQSHDLVVLRNNFLDHFSCKVSQAESSAVVFVRQLFMIHAQQMQNGGMHVIDMNGEDKAVRNRFAGFPQNSSFIFLSFTFFVCSGQRRKIRAATERFGVISASKPLKYSIRTINLSGIGWQLIRELLRKMQRRP